MLYRCVLAMSLGCSLLLITASSGVSAPANMLLARGRTEPVVAVDPRDPSHIVVTTNTNYDAPVSGAFPAGYFWSTDGGKSFRSGHAPVVWPYSTQADTSVAAAGDGTIFFAYLGETPAYCSGGRSAIFVTHSTDHGRSFRSPTFVDGDPADDKPNMAIESRPGRASHLYVTWTRWHDHTSDIWFSRSLNGGVTFSRPVMLYSSKSFNFGSVPLADGHGLVYVFWSTGNDTGTQRPARTWVMMRKSSSGGASFERAREASPAFWSIPRTATPGALRNLTIISVAADRAAHVYLTWPQVRRVARDGRVKADVVVIRSTNHGHSWSQPRAVNDVGDGDRFMPALTLMSDGSLGIVFYDRRDSPWNLAVYAVRVSFAGGFHASHNVRVTSGSSPISDVYYIAPGSTCFSPGRFFGDYIGAAAVGDNLAVVWADTQLHVPDETDVWFARVRLPGVPR